MGKRYEIVSADGERKWVDEDGRILADGERLVVSMMARDSMSDVQRAVADAAQSRPTFDTGGQGGRPGHAFDYQQAAAFKQAAYEDAKREMADAWRVPAINGAPGHLNAKLECIPDRQDARPVYDHAEGLRIKEAGLA